jgi:uncharacterized protein YecE (DUF72 family)
MNLYIGTSGFAYKEWKGNFYPKDLAPSGMLRFYSEIFRSVEINNTFYQIPKVSSVEAWSKEAPKDFKFVIKVPQRITHRKQIAHATGIMSQLLEAIAPLKKQLGPLLFQLPPWMKHNPARLRELLALLPPKQKAAFEFRHESWFDDETYDILRHHKSVLCIADAENELEVPFVSIADWGYLRLRRLDYTDSDLKKWATRIGQQKWQEAYIFFRHEDTGTGPHFGRRLMEFFGGAA